jgi:hypothetical protein
MVLFENIIVRWREWRDRQEEEPDLVSRLRKVWKEPGLPSPVRPAPVRTAGTLRPHAALHTRG